MPTLNDPRTGLSARLSPICVSAGAILLTLLSTLLLTLLLTLLPAPYAQAENPKKGAGIPRSARPAEARLYLISPADGETVSSPVVVRFGLGGMGVAPAGVVKGGTGHHHLVIDAELPAPHLPIPKDEHYRHFGGGQTEASIDLEPGTHTLQLMLGDHNHIPHHPPVVSEKITITVAK